MTSLQKQLAAIAASSTNQLDLKAQKAAHGKSLLYEPKIAASQSFDSIYLICYEGYRDLCALDHRFVPFARTLFSEQSKAEDRTQMTEMENKKLDSVLEAFITMIGPRLLLKPAEKALEWLVRRFRVHEYNTECLVLTYLSYHDTPQFLALLSILPATPPPTLRFLHPYITSVTNPPRTTIVYTAVNTPNFFTILQSYVVKVLQAGHQGSILLSFWSGVTTQAIDGLLEQSQSGRKEVQDRRMEELLFRVLPALNECLQISAVPEAVMGCYMIIIVLVSKGAFEDKVLDSLMEAVVRSQAPETMDGCFTCLSVIAEERSRTSIPMPVLRRLLRIPNMIETIQSLSSRCRIERLALGCALGALDIISRSARTEDCQDLFQGILEANLLDTSHVKIALSSLLRLLRKVPPQASEYIRLMNTATQLHDSTHIAQILQTVLKEEGLAAEFGGLMLQGPSSDLDENIRIENDDEDMLDVDQETDLHDGAPLVVAPAIKASSFLDTNSSEDFRSALSAFEQSVSSSVQLRGFLGSDQLGRKESLRNPLFLSFLIRTWCSPTSAHARIAAIRSTTLSLKTNDHGADLQNMIPYLLYALTDPSPHVRRAAATCIGALSSSTIAAEKHSGYYVWGSSDLYGKTTSNLSALPKGQTSNLLTSVLIPVLEECVMDPRFIITSIKSLMQGEQHSKSHSRHNLKSTARTSLIAFLGSHAALTPLLRVRLGLLPLFSFLGKTTNSVRGQIILPVVRRWCSLPVADAKEWCQIEKVAVADADKEHLATLIARESESAELLKETVSGLINQDRVELADLTFKRLTAMWPAMKSDSRLSIGQCLLNLALQVDGASDMDRLYRVRSLETLRAVKLDTSVLVHFVEDLPSALQMPEGPPTKKRRRTSRNEMARVELQSPDSVAKLLRRLTLVLELIEGSNPGEHPALFRNLFSILADLQQLKQQSGSDLVYLQSLVLSSLSPMVDQLKDIQDSSEFQAAVRVDLLIDCIRHSTSPQVQNGALLLIASLASWVPELVLHNLMPIFTFIGSTLLRQQDDYSAHVVDKTISRVVPQLAASLKSKHKDFLTGVADLLLSFTAAFEHIPHHRRLKLFSELAQTLGPADSLPAIVALLGDRYPTSTGQRKFVLELLVKFEPAVTLETFKGYLDLATDAVGPKRKIADTLFSLNEKEPSQLENTLYNLLSSIANLALNKSLHSHIGKAFRKSRNPAKPRAIVAGIVETTIQLSKKVTDNSRLYETCSRILTNCLNLLPTADLIKSTELLLKSVDHQVQIAAVKSVEVRTSSVIQNDQQAVSSLLSFLSKADELLQQSDSIEVKIISVSCVDRIIERFGKKDVAAVAAVANTISGAVLLGSTDDRLRTLSLLCVTSVVDVLEEEAISLLPIVLPTAFEYLKSSIEQEKNGLHNAVFALLSNVVERLPFMFSREYLVPALELAQRSAAAGMDETCDETRQQFYLSVAQHIGAKEVFAASKEIWPSALSRGFEATSEILDLILSTINNQPQSGLIKASSTLFTTLLELFSFRHTISTSDPDDSEPIDEEDIDQIENTLIESVIAMTLKLNDTTFRPFFAQLVDHVDPKDKQSSSLSITFYKFLAVFFERFKSIVTSYSSYIIENASQILEHLSTKPEESILRKALLSALHNAFAHDVDGFWSSPSHSSSILAPLLKQLKVPLPLTTTENEIIPAIVELAVASSSSPDNHRELNAILLKYMRAEEAPTRLATVKCEQALTKRLGEEWLALLPEMLPFIAELREDDDETVERETQRWISNMEEILGEDLEGMLQ